MDPATPSAPAEATPNPPAQSDAAPVPAQAPAPVTSPVAENRPITASTDAGRGSLPTDLDSIDEFFRNGKPLTVSNTAVEGAPTETTPAPATPEPAKAPVSPAGDTPPEPVKVEPVSTPELPADVRRAMDLQKSLNGDKQPGTAGFVTLTDAITRISDADKPAPTEPPVDHVAVTGEKVTTINGEIAELEKQLDALADDSSFFGPKHSELVKAIQAKNRELNAAERAAEKAQDEVERTQQAQQNAGYQRERDARQSAMTKAAADFPSAASKATPLGKRITSLVAAMQSPNHPDHEVLKSANAAILVTQTAAIAEAQDIAKNSDGKITFAQAFDSLRAADPVPAAPKVETEPRRVSPVPGSSGTLPPAAQPTDAQILKATEDDPDLLDKLLYPQGKTFAVR